MKKLNTRRTVAAVALALGSVAATAIPAQATTGGLVCNMSSSDHNLYVSAYRPAKNAVKVPIGLCSTHVGVSNVQAFFSGWRMQSVWITSGGGVYRGYIYSGGTWHYMSTNNVRLSLDVLP
jgi:hypothetical protein